MIVHLKKTAVTTKNRQRAIGDPYLHTTFSKSSKFTTR